MVRREDLRLWFKTLPAHRRIDYMCDLLRMCLPLELRFFGTVLEDLAKKDFHILRDQENKVNQRTDLSSNSSGSLSDKKLRAKIITALALMNSTNGPCAEVIFEILQREFENILDLLRNRNDHNAVDDLILLFTMAVHHPAFSFYQRSQLAQVLNRIEGYSQEFNRNYNERDVNLFLPEQNSPPPNVLSKPEGLRSEKATIQKIKLINADIHRNKTDYVEYRIQAFWSNGEVTESVLKYKQLHDLQSRIQNKFPELKNQISFDFPKTWTPQVDSTGVHMYSLNVFFSRLLKKAPHVLVDDPLTEVLRNGRIVSPTSGSATSTSPITTASPHQLQPPVLPATVVGGDTRHGMLPRQQPEINYSSVVNSAKPSPVSSGTSSPASLTEYNNFGAPSDAVRGSNTTNVPGIGMQHPAHVTDDTLQLLQLLNLQHHYDSLKDYSVQQMNQWSKEDFDKAGLPAEAQAKIRSKLSQIKPPEVNGMVDPNRQMLETHMLYYNPCYPYSVAPLSLYYPHQFYQPVTYSPHHLGHITMVQSPHLQTQTIERSPGSSEASSPRSSPLLPSMVGFDHYQVPPGQLIPTPANQASDAMTVLDGKLNNVDSSSSEDDRPTGYGQKPAASRNKCHAKAQHSLPVIHQSIVPLPEAVSPASVLIAMPVPHNQSNLIAAAEPRIDGTPPLMPPAAPVGAASAHMTGGPPGFVNGYIADPPPGTPPQMPVMDSRTFKGPHPAPPMGLFMGASDMLQAYNIGKNGANNGSLSVLHGSAPYSINIPVPSAIPANFQARNAFQPAHAPPLMSEVGSMYPRYIISPARGILQKPTTAVSATQPHAAGPFVSHPPTPATTTVCAVDQTHAPYVRDSVYPEKPEEVCLTSPSHVASVLKHQSEANSSSPESISPPAAPLAHKQTGTNDPQAGPQAPQMFQFMNGCSEMLPHVLYSQAHPPQQHMFPNGITSEYRTLLPLPPHVAPNLYSVMYGSVYPPHSPVGTPQNGPVPQTAPIPQTAPGPQTSAVPQTAPVPISTGTTSSSSQSSGGMTDKSKCYNCGHSGHEVSECKESRMETMSSKLSLAVSP